VFSSLTTLFTALTQSSSIMVFKCAYDETAEPKNVMPINETDYIKSYVVIESIVGITHQIITGLYQHEAVFFLPAASIEYANHQLVSFKFVDKKLN
jgi:hypothetical protein